jgi:hypothetical protein
VEGVLAVALADPDAWLQGGRAEAAGWRILGVPADGVGGGVAPVFWGKPEARSVDSNA